MTTAPDPADLRAKQLHASALAHTSPQTLARLRQARQAAREAGLERAAARRRSPWFAGGALAAALVVAVALRPDSTPQAPGPAATVAVEAATPLQEDPGFYLWLASADVPALALE